MKRKKTARSSPRRSARLRKRQLREAGYAALELRMLLAAAGNWEVRSPGGGGALFAPAISPHNAAEMYVQSDMSQTFRTRDSGASWDTLDFAQLGGGNRGGVQYTSNANVLYAIDFAAIDGLDAAVPVRSNDGGNTWIHLPDPVGGEAYQLFADYSQPDRVIVTDWNRLYLSVDGGATWALRYTAPASDGLHVGGVFFDGANIYAGTNHGLLRSTNSGSTFQLTALTGFAAGEDLVTMTGAREGNTVRLYAVAQNTQVWGGYMAWDWYDYSNVYRLDIGQASWTPVGAGLPADAKPYFVDMARNDVDTLYVAGNDENGLPLIFKSVNSGGTWSDVFLWQNNQNIATGWQGQGGHIYWWWGEGALGFEVNPLNSAQALVTDFGFAHTTDNGGTTWRNVNVVPADLNPVGGQTSTTRPYRTSGLGNTAIWNLTWLDQQTMLAGFSDIEMALSHDGGRGWSFDYSGLGQNSLYRAVVHPNGNVYAATSTVHDLYESTRTTDSIIDAGSGRVMVSGDDGHAWQLLKDFGHVVRWVELDPSNPQRLYVSVVHSVDGGIYVTNNLSAGSGATWQRLTAPPRTEGHPYNIHILDDGTLLTTWSARQPGSGGGNFTASSGVFISTDGGATWLDRTDTRMRYWTRDITVDPHDPTQNTWYTGVYSGWGGPANDLGGLYRTTNRGQTWELFYEAHRVTSATVHPLNADELYLTTETDGLVFSGNRRAAQPTFSRVAGMDFRQPLQVHFNPWNANEVWVTTFGGQLWVGTTPDPVAGGDFAVANGKLTLDGRALDQVITATREGTSYRFTLQSGNWTGGANTGISGAGTASLLVARTMLDGLSGGLLVRESPGSVVDLVFAGTADFSTMAGPFTTESLDDISQTAGSIARFGRARFGASTISLPATDNVFGTLAVTGASATLTASSAMLLEGTNNVGQLTLKAGGRIGNLVGATISVTGNLRAETPQRIDFAWSAGDVLNVGGTAIFSTGSQPLLVGNAGLASFGVLWIDAAGFVRLRETGDTRIGRLVSSGSVQLNSTGSIADGGQARVDVRYQLGLTAANWIIVADSAADTWSVGGLATLGAGSSVNVLAAGQTSVGQLSFAAGTSASVNIDGSLFLAGTSTAASARLAAGGAIGDATGADLRVTGGLTLVAGTRIDLGDQTGDELVVGGLLDAQATEAVQLLSAGLVQFGQLRFSAPWVLVQSDSRIHLMGQSSGGIVRLETADVISDGAGASVEATTNAIFVARGVTLADQADNELHFCTHLRLEVTAFALIHAPGNVTISSYWVTPGVFSSIIVDSVC